MKKICLLTAVLGLFGLATTVQAASANALSLTFQINAAVQKTVSVTNNTTATTTLTTTSVKIASADILKMIETEFNTNFPTGAKLGYSLDTSGFVVVDKNGNQLLDAKSNPANLNYRFALSNDVINLDVPQSVVGKEVLTESTGSETVVATVSLPDEGVFYRDGHGNDFHFIGLVQEKVNGIQGNGPVVIKSVTITLNGTGAGSFFNSKDNQVETGVFTSAKMSASGKNLTD